MPDNENPAPKKGRASRVSFADWTPEALTLSACRAQCLITTYGVQPELAVMLAAVALGGTRHG